MNSEQRSKFLISVSIKVFDYIKNHRKIKKPDHLIKSFCKDNKIERANVELALAILINKKDIKLNKDFEIGLNDEESEK